jgi:hypothetical protein
MKIFCFVFVHQKVFDKPTINRECQQNTQFYQNWEMLAVNYAFHIEFDECWEIALKISIVGGLQWNAVCGGKFLFRIEERKFRAFFGTSDGKNRP